MEPITHVTNQSSGGNKKSGPTKNELALGLILGLPGITFPAGLPEKLLGSFAQSNEKMGGK